MRRLRVLALAGLFLAGNLAFAADAEKAAGPGAGGEMPDKKTCETATDPVVIGGCIATHRTKGNCHACHQFAGVEKTRLQVGNIAPPLVAMQQRFPDKAKLKAQIYDPQVANPHTVMPPYGKHGILSDKEIDYIVEFLYTL
jgi:sulfur-oxidizing protein SoxX